MPVSDSADVFKFLASPASHAGQPVQQIDTHLSHIFLTGTRAYKLKRPVKYDFVDYSTVALRKAACERELEINRRTAPALYLGVKGVYPGNGAGHCDWRGAGAPIDYVVEMLRFDQELQLDRLADNRKLQPADIQRLALVVADLHKAAEIRRDAGFPQNFSQVIDQLASTLTAQRIDGVHEAALEDWASRIRVLDADCSSILSARDRHGRTRLCHGDLHLANICMLDGRPTPFDAIEFNQSLSDIDVLYDFSFLLMDLLAHRLKKLANILLNTYLTSTRDYSGLALTPLFLSARAAVRAMVLGLTGGDAARRKRRSYFELAQECLKKPQEPRLIAISGYSGTGKSTIAERIAVDQGEPFGAILLQSDVIRKRLFQLSPKERLPENAYDEAITDRAYAVMRKDAGRALRAGQSIILDATFLNPTQRLHAEKLANANGARFTGIWLSAPRDVLIDRLKNRTGSISDASLDVLNAQLDRGRGGDDWPFIDVSGAIHDSIAIMQSYVAQSLKQ